VRITFDAIPPDDPRNLFGLPTILIASGNRDFASEELLAYEIGYRVQATEQLSLDIAAFYNDYDHLLTGELGTPIPEPPSAPTSLFLPVIGDNKMNGETYGAELAVDYQALDWWRLQASYSYLQIQLHLDSDSSDRWFEAAEGRSPQHQLSLRSVMNLPQNFELDVWGRSVDRLPSFNIGSYVTLDVRLGWKVHETIELSIVGQNLLDDHQPEFGMPFFIHTVPTEVERGVYGKIRWQF
jgi:iron complex outermembrane receptor protein